MDPQQELFTRLKLELETMGYDVYDGVLPPEDTPYPFIYLGDNRTSDRQLKNAVMGSTYQTIHVWHNDPRQRGTVSSMIFAVKQVCYRIEHTEHYAWGVRNVDQRIIPDNTTKKPLLHGIIEVEYQFS